jgi:transposase-like protein
VKVKGSRIYLYGAVDKSGQTIDFLLSAKRYAEAAKRFFRKPLVQPHTVNPRKITVDKNAAYPKAAAEMQNVATTAFRTKTHRSRIDPLISADTDHATARKF